MFSLNKKIQFFNMIEILLALAVIAIGMTSVLGLFPVGLNASRNAVAENCSADIADQMVTYLRVMGESSTEAYTATFVTPATNIPDYNNAAIPYGLNVYTNTEGETTINLDGVETFIDDDIYYPPPPDPPVLTTVGLSEKFLNAYKTDKVGFTNSIAVDGVVFKRVAPGWAIFTKDPSGTLGLRRRVYFITQGPNCTEDGGNRNVDYSAMALVWKDTVQIRRFTGGDPTVSTNWEPWPSDTIMGSGTISQKYEFSGMINIELSWPLELPYAERKKRYYQIVISRPN